MAPKTVNLIWIRLPSKEAFAKMAEIVNDPKTFNISVKMETESSAYGAFLDVFRDLLWALQWLVIPAILATMCLIVANAISISVRERRTEMAVLKVLGFGPKTVVFLVLGESILLGLAGGLLSSGLLYLAITGMGGVPFPIGFFPKYNYPIDMVIFGGLIGFGTSLLGSIVPALSSLSVKASQVFAKVA
jgi:putative ABC transport system permease protein